MNIRSSVREVLLCCSFVPVVSTGYAQQAPVALDQVLAQLEVNTAKYMSNVPSFTCAEHITSEEIQAGKVKHETTVEAIFRVSRSAQEAGVLEESREVLAVDGRPSDGKKLHMPLAFSGGFSGALTKFLSDSHRECFTYEQVPSSAGTLAFNFVANDESLDKPACRSIQKGTTGRVSVDASAMQVTHIERTVPFPIGKDQSVLSTAAVDFMPVKLKDAIFWLPVTVTAYTTETAKTNGLKFTARYSGYQRFGASSMIVPVEQ